jgi:hypothetical protein
MNEEVPFYRSKRFYGFLIAAIGLILQGQDAAAVLSSIDWKEALAGGGVALFTYGAAVARGPLSLS